MRRRSLTAPAAVAAVAVLAAWTDVGRGRAGASPDPAPRAATLRPARPVHTRTGAPPPPPDAPSEPTFTEPAGETGWEHAEALDDRARLDLVIVDSEGGLVEGARVLSEDCRLMAWAELGEVTLYPDPGTCTLRAGRQDGLLTAWSPPVEVDLFDGEQVVVELEIPAERAGGLGVQIALHDEGVEVLSVIEGTPAWQEGLEPGDVIVEVDGIPVVDLGLESFIEQMTGPEGSEVDFVVAYPDGDTGRLYEPISIARAWLDPALMRD